MRILEVKFPNNSDSVQSMVSLLHRGFNELGHECDIGGMETRHNYDVVHSHWFSDVFGYDGPPLFMTYHGARGRIFTHNGKNYQPVKYLADGNGVQGIAISHFQSGDFGLPVVHNGVDVDSYYSGQKNGDLLSMARICPEKGQDIAARVAIKTVRTLTLAGPAHCSRFFAENVMPLLGPGVQYVGYAGYAMKRKLLAESAALLNPVICDEGFSVTMIEAMASGCPVVGFDRGSLSEALGECGVLVNTEEELSDAILKREYEKITPEMCLNRAKKFSYLNMCRGYLDIFDKAK